MDVISISLFLFIKFDNLYLYSTEVFNVLVYQYLLQERDSSLAVEFTLRTSLAFLCWVTEKNFVPLPILVFYSS